MYIDERCQVMYDIRYEYEKLYISVIYKSFNTYSTISNSKTNNYERIQQEEEWKGLNMTWH